MTHLKHEENVLILWFGFDRSFIHVNSKRYSGGVGILIKQKIQCKFDISIFDKTVDGILGMKLIDKLNDTSVVIFACYLSPESSPWGRDSQEYFSHLLSQTYLSDDIDYNYIPV